MPFQPGQEDQGHLPGAELRHEDEGELGPGRIAEPVDVGQPEANQELIEDALGRVHQDEEDEGEGEERDDRRQVEDGAVDRDLGQRLVHGQGQPHGDDDPDRHRQRRVVERVVERRPEELVVEQGLVVAETDPFRLTEPGVLGEADAQGVEDRVDQEGEEADDPGADEEETDAQVRRSFLVRLTRPNGLGADGRHRGSQRSSSLSQERAADRSRLKRTRRPALASRPPALRSDQAMSIGQNPCRSGWTRSLTVGQRRRRLLLVEVDLLPGGGQLVPVARSHRQRRAVLRGRQQLLGEEEVRSGPRRGWRPRAGC